MQSNEKSGMSGTGGEVDSGMWKRITTVNRDRKDRNQINRRRKKKQKDIIDVSSFLSTMKSCFIQLTSKTNCFIIYISQW